MPRETPLPTAPPAGPGPASKGEPAWWAKLPASERPPLPLPKGLELGAAPGEYVNAKDGSTLVFVPGGTFLMGSAEGAPFEAPVHAVSLSPYFVGKLEVAVEQFAAFAAATGWKTEAELGEGGEVLDDDADMSRPEGITWRTPDRPGEKASPRHPVTHVTWSDVQAYCRWAGLRLPTEAEWERACAWDARARVARRFAWGDHAPGKGSPRVANVSDESLVRRWPKLHTWNGLFERDDPESAFLDKLVFPRRPIFDGYDDGHAKAAPVGSFEGGASPVGALDMTGNVAEWCQDAFEERFYARSPRADPVNDPKDATTRVSRVVRGGSFGSTVRATRASFRVMAMPSLRTDVVGFRVCRSAR